MRTSTAAAAASSRRRCRRPWSRSPSTAPPSGRVTRCRTQRRPSPSTSAPACATCGESARLHEAHREAVALADGGVLVAVLVPEAVRGRQRPHALLVVLGVAGVGVHL